MAETGHGQDLERAPHSYIGAEIDLNVIGVLPQPRQTFEDIDLLAQSIADNGLLHPLIVAEFDQGGCQQYLQTINQMWHTEHVIEELPVVFDEEGNPVWHVLLAGERRYRACQVLNHAGCAHCQETYGEGPCYERHFGGQTVEVRLLRGAKPIEALRIQAQENTHKAVPAHEEAYFYAIFYEMMKKGDENYSLAHCARDVGRSPSTIRTALRYATLPENVQKYVQDGKISYGIAVEISRLKEELNMSDELLEDWVIRAMVNQYKVSEFSELINKYIIDKRLGQTEFDFFGGNEVQAYTRRMERYQRTAAHNMVGELWLGIVYMEQILDLYEQGKIGKEFSPYSLGSPLRVLDAFANTLQRTTDHLRGVMSVANYEKILQALERYKELRQSPQFAEIFASLM